MDLLVVVLVDGGVLLGGEGSEGGLDDGVGVLGADHEADLAGGVGGDGGVGVLGNGEDLLAGLLEVLDDGEVQPNVLGLGGDDTLLGEGLFQELKVGLLEEGLGGALGVGGVSDDDVKGVLVLGKELEAVANVDSDTGVLETNGEVLEVLLGDTGDGLVNVTKHGGLNALVLDDLTEDTTVTTANDENLLGVGVRVEGKVGDHLLVGELVALGDLDGTVENENVTVVGGLENENLNSS